MLAWRDADFLGGLMEERLSKAHKEWLDIRSRLASVCKKIDELHKQKQSLEMQERDAKQTLIAVQDRYMNDRKEG